VVERAKQGLAGQEASLKARPTKEAAKQLLRQLDLILNMVLLPYMILMMEEGKVQGLREAFGVVIGKKHKKTDRRHMFEKHSKIAMKRFFALDVSGSLSRPWLSAATVYIWTAFECLAADLWENSLNDRTVLAHRTLSSIPGDDTGKSGLSRRHIEVGLAARHGFDLRRCLGTLLKSKFDFTSFEGIEAAYKQAFGTDELQGFQDLKELEQVRHLIVHRGGVVDEKFLRVTNLKARRGVPLSPKVSQVCDYMIAVTLACVSLLKSVDQRVVRRRQLGRNDQGSRPRTSDY
jgi:hypothetical protein